MLEEESKMVVDDEDEEDKDKDKDKVCVCLPSPVLINLAKAITE